MLFKLNSDTTSESKHFTFNDNQGHTLVHIDRPDVDRPAIFRAPHATKGHRGEQAIQAGVSITKNIPKRLENQENKVKTL